MGAFHTSCTFLAVIGKRFADAGLRDIIVEANLLGRNSLCILLSLPYFFIYPNVLVVFPGQGNPIKVNLVWLPEMCHSLVILLRSLIQTRVVSFTMKEGRIV